MPKRTPGLHKKGDFWYIDKVVQGRRIQGSTGCRALAEAEQVLQRRIAEAEQGPTVIWREAATKYLRAFIDKKSIGRDAQDLEALDPYIGHLPLTRVHAGSLEPFIEDKRKAGWKASSVNRALAICGRVLKLCSRMWRHPDGGPWLRGVPMLPRANWNDARKPHPLSQKEQARFFAELPAHLSRMALFVVNTGLRNREACGLKWEDMTTFHGEPVFVLPETKNGEERVVVLNRIARVCLPERSGTYVFTFTGGKIWSMQTTAWRKATKRLGTDYRPHDLRHTFGRRLRAAGVPLETRKALLGHTNGDITTHYSAAEIGELRAAVERICDVAETPTLTVIGKS